MSASSSNITVTCLSSFLVIVLLSLSSSAIASGDNSDMEHIIVTPDPYIDTGTGGGIINYEGTGGGGSGGFGAGGSGSSSAQQQRAKEYSDCVRRAQAGVGGCISSYNSQIEFAYNVCSSAAAGVGTSTQQLVRLRGIGAIVSSLYGVIAGALNMHACSMARTTDLGNVSGICQTQADNKKANC